MPKQRNGGQALNLKYLLNGICAQYDGADANVDLITHNLDTVTAGTLFVCIKGAHADGHALAQAALEKGAVAVVCERDLGLQSQILVEDSRRALALLSNAFYDHPDKKLVLIGLTGTNGKTTTACWLRSILENADRKTALIGTLGADSGHGFEQTGHTTPDAVVFNRTLHESVQSGCECAVAEISSQALSQERCASLRFAVAVFTNLSAEHLDYHQSMQEYAQQKAKLFAMAETAVVNADDEYAPFILSHCKGRTITYSLQDQADLTAKNIQYSENGVSYVLVSRDGIARIRVASPGVIAVYNSMAAIAASLAVGVDFELASELACELPQVEGRMQRILPQAPFAVYADYAHTPTALYEALYALRQVTKGRVIAVFGCGGDRDRTKRPKMGEIASALADITILTNDNPRTEDPQSILSEIASGFNSKKELFICADRREAIREALLRAQPGDSVLIAGKGHEKTQMLANEEIAFDDIAVAQELFALHHV